MIRLFLPLLMLGACAPDAPKPTTKVVAKPDPDALPVYRVAVAPDGLLLTDRRGGAAKPADFGLRQSLLIAILARSFGPAAEGRDPGCTRDFARWPNGLTLWFEAGTFSGWSLNNVYAAIGVAPGLTPAKAIAAGKGCRAR